MAHRLLSKSAGWRVCLRGGHGCGSQVRTSLSTSRALPATRRWTRTFSGMISDVIRFRWAQQSRLNGSGVCRPGGAARTILQLAVQHGG